MKQPLPICSKLSGRETDESFEHSSKANCPISVTPSGMTTETKFVQAQKAYRSMRLTGHPPRTEGTVIEPLAEPGIAPGMNSPFHVPAHVPGLITAAPFSMVKVHSTPSTISTSAHAFCQASATTSAAMSVFASDFARCFFCCSFFTLRSFLSPVAAEEGSGRQNKGSAPGCLGLILTRWRLRMPERNMKLQKGAPCLGHASAGSVPFVKSFSGFPSERRVAVYAKWVRLSGNGCWVAFLSCWAGGGILRRSGAERGKGSRIRVPG